MMKFNSVCNIYAYTAYNNSALLAFLLWARKNCRMGEEQEHSRRAKEASLNGGFPAWIGIHAQVTGIISASDFPCGINTPGRFVLCGFAFPRYQAKHRCAVNLALLQKPTHTTMTKLLILLVSLVFIFLLFQPPLSLSPSLLPSPLLSSSFS